MPNQNRTVTTPTIALDSLGCKLNQAEIQRLARQLAAAGYRLAGPGEKADIFILNTCTVTHVADRKSRHMLRLARKRNPAARLIAIGCYAERAAAELSQIEGVELVLGNDRKADLLSLLGEQTQRPSPEIPLMVSERLVAIPYEERNRDLSNRRTRTFIKAQEGCRNFCAYCVVPLVRSKEQSVPADEIIAQINEVVAGGGKEVVLTGTEIGAYNSEGADLKGLVERILAETDIRRLRLSSLQPHQVTPELVALWKDPRLCPHFHLSLQNGSDTVLKRMRRLYTTADYRKTVALIRKSAPDGAITTDIIVGFPGETEAEFKESHDFCAEMRFARIHVFPFSPRPGTAAATMPNQVKEKVKKERSRLMLALAKESARDFHLRFLGKTMEVLWEQQSGSAWTGLTGNYIKVYVNSSKNLTDEITPVKLVKVYKDGVWGEEEG